MDTLVAVVGADVAWKEEGTLVYVQWLRQDTRHEQRRNGGQLQKMHTVDIRSLDSRDLKGWG